MLKRRQRRYVDLATLQETVELVNPLLEPLDPSEREQRRERGREDVPWWLRTYLPHYFTFPFSLSHERVFELFYVKGQLVVIVLPRDAGKGTTLFGLTLHGMTYDLLPFPTRVEHNFDIALQELYKFEDALTKNPRYLADYDLRPGSPWRASKGLLTLNNGRQLRYIGMDQVARGTVSLNFRIDPLIANDLESLTSVRSPTQTQKIFDFMTKDSAHAGAALSEGGHTYLYVGTKLSQNCATQRMIDSPMAESYEFPALVGDPAIVKDLMDTVSTYAGDMKTFNRQIRESRADLPRSKRNPSSEDRKQYVMDHPEFARFLPLLHSYWEARFALWDLIFEAGKGSDIFMQEMMHSPGDAAFQKFHDHWFQHYDTFPPGDYAFGIGIDTSGEPKEGSDPMAIVAGAYNRTTENFYVLEFLCDQFTPEEMVHEAIRMYDQYFRSQHRLAYVYLEAIVSATGLGKAFFEKTAIADGLTPIDNLVEVHQVQDKQLRIAAMRPIAEQRRIFVNRAHSQQKLLVTQWCNWQGQATHKNLPPEFKIDGPDAMTLLFQRLSVPRRDPPAQSQEPRRQQPHAQSAYQRFRRR